MVEILVIIINIIPCKGALKWFMNINTNIINPIVGEDEIMTRNILNVIRGIKIQQKNVSYIHIFPGFADPPIVEKVKMFFTNNESTLYSMQLVVNTEVRSISPQTRD